MQLYLKDMYRIALAILMNDEDAADASRSADILADSRVMTRREAGEPEDEGLNPEEKMAVITFELQKEGDGAQ